MTEDEVLALTFEGAVDVARWTCSAWQSGHFDWNLIAGDNSGECVAERWRVVRWWNAEGLLESLDEPNVEDRELTAAIMFAFVTANLRATAERENVTPQDWMDLVLGNADRTAELS